VISVDVGEQALESRQRTIEMKEEIAAAQRIIAQFKDYKATHFTLQ